MSNNNFIMDPEEVKAWLALKASTAQDPALSDPEIEILLKENSIGSVWAEATLYKIDSVVVPTSDNRMGRRFRCVVSGTSDDVEPEWALFSRSVHAIYAGTDLGNEGSNKLVLNDGDTLLWVDDGAETDLWDLEELAASAWLAKAAKASDLMRLNRGGNDYDLEALFRHATDMASRFGGAWIK